MRCQTLRPSHIGILAKSSGSSTWRPARGSPAHVFYVLRGKGARLHRALSNWLLNTLTEEFGYTEIAPPLLVRPDTMTGSGNLPKFEDNLYRDEETDLWLVPTAEVGLNGPAPGADHRAARVAIEVRSVDAVFPQRTHSSRAGRAGNQAGAPVREGRDVPLRRAGGLGTCIGRDGRAGHYPLRTAGPAAPRVGAVRGRDLGFQSAKTYDIEVWAPGSGEWLEVSSVSTLRRLPDETEHNTRFRPERGARTRFPHTLNGSAFGMPRLLIAALENGALPDGSTEVPEPIREYTGFDRIP